MNNLSLCGAGTLVDSLNLNNHVMNISKQLPLTSACPATASYTSGKLGSPQEETVTVGCL